MKRSRVSVAVDLAIFTIRGKLQIQLERGRKGGIWSLPGSFVQERESLDDAAGRTLREVTGLEAVYHE
ncbi:MAG: NUDIX domain-containing protein, partial [Planctomycetota bacterium]